jgi:hypothetical protein
MMLLAIRGHRGQRSQCQLHERRQADVVLTQRHFRLWPEAAISQNWVLTAVGMPYACGGRNGKLSVRLKEAEPFIKTVMDLFFDYGEGKL